MPFPQKPEELHQLHGTTPQPVVRGGSDIPEGRPRFGGVTDEERPHFKRIIGLLEARRHLTKADGEILRIYAAAAVRYHKFKEVLKNEGWTVLTEDGLKEHPVAKHFYKAESVMLGILDDLGLKPSAKDRIKPAKRPTETPDDPMAALIDRTPIPFVVRDPLEVDDEPAEPAKEQNDEDVQSSD